MENTYKVNKKAVEKIIERVYDNGSTVINKNDLEEIFPELKESDDERIRKALIEGFKVMKDNSYGECTFSNYNIPVTDVIAWLEKQGEQKSLDDIAKEVTKDKDTAISFFKSAGIINENGELADEYKIEQGEQKPQRMVSAEAKEAMYDKPAEWSEEDEKFIKELCNLLASIAKDGYVGKYYAPDLVNKLQSLRPHKYVYLYECIKECDGFKVGNIYKSDGEWVYGDNKKCAYDERFFRSQNHWKPSDKQISALEWQTNNTYQGSWQYEASKELLEQLKKLKE